MKKIFFMLSLSFFIAALPAADWTTIINKSGPAIGRVVIENSHGSIVSEGSGFTVLNGKGNQIFVTNAHVVRDAWYDKSMTITVSFDFDGENNASSSSITAKILRIDTSIDLCLIALDGQAPATLTLGPEKKPDLMTELIVAGYPLGKSFKATTGMIQAYQTIDKTGEMIDISATLAPGNSGGPVLDRTGEVIGIATAIIRGYNFNLAIPAGNIKHFINYEADSVTLDISGDPAGSRIFVNGDFRGESPLKLSLYNTEYSLRIEKDGFEPYESKIGPWDSREKNQIAVTLTPIEKHNPVISIITSPPGAQIYIGNSRMGVSPVSIEMNSGRILRIRAVWSPFKKKSMNYRVTDEKDQTVHLDQN